MAQIPIYRAKKIDRDVSIQVKETVATGVLSGSVN